MRSNMKLGRIGVHGESLGGSIACYLARKCDLKFLFADRAFASLSETGYFGGGGVSYWILRLFLKNDCDTVAEFLGTRCYKLMSFDHNDKMINDLASLKSGVALRTVYPNYSLLSLAYYQPKVVESLEYILNYKEISSLINSLSSIVNKSKNNECLSLVVKKLESLDAGGKPLIKVLYDKNIGLSALLWIIVFDLWGSACYTSGKFDCHMKGIQSISQVIETIQKCFDEVSLNELSIISDSLIKISKHLEEKCGIHGELDDFSQVAIASNFAVIGKLLPLACGHSQYFNYAERSCYTKHIQNFIDLHEI